MLSLMRRKAGSWIIKVILGAIVVVFVFWGVGSFRDQGAGGIASVNGETISVEEYRDTYNNLLEIYRQNFGDSLNDELLKALGLRQQALNQIIDKKLLMAEAKRLEFRVSDEELAERILTFPAFQENGQFSDRRYRYVLSRSRLTPEGFEQLQRESMLQEKLSYFVASGLKVSELEAREWYDWNNATVDIEYLVFDPRAYTDIQPTEEEISTYFGQNKESYKTQPRRKVRYLRFGPEDYQTDISVSPDEIQTYYETNSEEFKTPKTVEARHILIKVAQDADDETVEAARKKALDVHAKAIKGEDFAELAKTYSEGPTKDNGGYLGAFKKGDMVAPFSEQAFSMAAGDVSEPVRTPFGWHVIKVEKVNEASFQTLEEATAAIGQKLVDEQAKIRAYDAAEAVYEESFEGDNLADTAAARKLSLHTSPLFTRQGPVEGILDSTKFASAAFELDLNEISEVQDLGDGFYLLQLIEEKPSEIPDLSEVADRVRADVIKEKQDQKAREAAESLLDDLNKGGTLAELSQAHGLSPVTTGFFKRNKTDIANLGYEPGIIDAAFKLSAENDVHPEAIKGRKGYYLIRLLARKLPDDTGFADEKKAIEQRLLGQKQAQAYAALLADLKAKSEISIQEGFIQ